MKPRRAFSLIELILGLAVLIIALTVFLTVFSSSSSQAVQSRNRTVAIILANTMMDELEAHPYGAPEPPSWNDKVDRPVDAWAEGHRQEMDFHTRLTYANGSFVGKTKGDDDLVTITISWKEGVGIPQPGVVAPLDDKILSVRAPVWR